MIDRILTVVFAGHRVGLLVALIAFSASGAKAANADDYAPIFVPKTVIYAGQAITPSLLIERRALIRYLRTVSVVTSLDQVKNLVARTTLMPNRPIPTNHLEEKTVVRAGKLVRMFYASDGLSITTEVVPLNSGKSGDFIRARNARTGIVVSGIAQPDGSLAALDQ